MQLEPLENHWRSVVDEGCPGRCAGFLKDVGHGGGRMLLQSMVPISNGSLVLAADRTYRRDPLNGFRHYRGGWDIKNQSYWSVSTNKAACSRLSFHCSTQPFGLSSVPKVFCCSLVDGIRCTGHSSQNAPC